MQTHHYSVTTDADLFEFGYQQGWDDGLPVALPAPAKVEAMLAAGALAPEDELGRIPERARVLTARHLAANAVMAGCLPAYMPVLVAAVKAICDPRFGLHGPASSTAGHAILLVVGGEAARRAGMNPGENCFGPGNRANATIGRAIRLLLMNAGGSRQFDRATLGHPGKYSYCIAERDDLGPGWTPLFADRGVSGPSGLTAFACEAPNQVRNEFARNPEGILLTVADRMRALGGFNMVSAQEYAVVLCPEHQATIAAAGWDKQRVREFLWQNARRPKADLKRWGLMPGEVTPEDETTLIHAVRKPDDILLLVAGGEAGRFSHVMGGWGRMDFCKSVTVPIEEVN